MGFLSQIGIELIHFLGLLLLAAIGGLISLWRDHSRVSDRLGALEMDYDKEKELLHKRISGHEDERKLEYKELRQCITNVHADMKELNGKLEVYTQNYRLRVIREEDQNA